jgi:hypothetical protein
VLRWLKRMKAGEGVSLDGTSINLKMIPNFNLSRCDLTIAKLKRYGKPSVFRALPMLEPINHSIL